MYSCNKNRSGGCQWVDETGTSDGLGRSNIQIEAHTGKTKKKIIKPQQIRKGTPRNNQQGKSKIRQEPYTTTFNAISKEASFRSLAVFQKNRFQDDAQIRSRRSVIWVNKRLNTKDWTILDIPNTNDITAIQLELEVVYITHRKPPRPRLGQE